MNPIERQILKNQREIMINSNNDGFFSMAIKETEELLHPNKEKEDCCDMSEVNKK